MAQFKVRALGILLDSWTAQLRGQCPKDFLSMGHRHIGTYIGCLQGSPRLLSFKCSENCLTNVRWEH